jgi:hypothetical protein
MKVAVKQNQSVIEDLMRGMQGNSEHDLKSMSDQQRIMAKKLKALKKEEQRLT